MKKFLASMMISVLLVLPSPALASTSSRVNVEKLTFDMIEQHVNSYNTQIHTNNKIDITVPTDNDKTILQGLIADVNSQITGYNTKITEINGLPADQNRAYLINIYQALIANSTSNKTTLQNQLNKFDENRTKAQEAKSKAGYQVEAGNRQVIWGAEQLFITYNNLYNQIKQQNNQLYLLHNQLNVMKTRKELGLVSNLTYQSLEKSVKELELAVKSMNNQYYSLKEQLNLMLDQNYDSALEIGDTPELDLDLLKTMSLEDDYIIAAPLSYSVKAKLDADSKERESEERKFKLDFKESYQNVLDKKESLDLAEYTLANQKVVYLQAQVRYKVGLISKLTLEEQQISYDNQVLNVEIAKDNLFKAYRQYEWMKKGLSI